MTGKNGKNNKNLDSLPKQIVLFDSTCKFENFKEHFETCDKVITFDYFSHKLLSSKQIPHEISDDLLSESELSSIQSKSYRLSEWFSQDVIQELLNYEDVNLGELYYSELHYFLVPFLKKLMEIEKITSKYSNSIFITFGLLLQIINDYSEKTKKIISDQNQSEEFLYDSVTFPLKIGNLSHTLKFSRKNYKKIKSLPEKFFDKFFGNKKRFSPDKKTVLFIEFDTVRYQKILSQSKNYPINLISYCRRRPSIWNKLSYNIIKNSNCIIETEFSLHDNSNNVNAQKISQNKLSELWKMEDFFEDFFSLNNKSFWRILSPFFKQLTGKRFLEAIYEINLATKLFDKYNLSSISVWSELGFNEKIFIRIAKKRKIPIVLFQHGLGFETKEAIEYTKFMGGIPKLIDHYIVWGESFKNFLIKSNFDQNKIQVLGSTLHDDLKDYPNSKNDDYILLATSSPVKNLIKDLLVNTQINYENAIKEICNITTKLNKKLVIKLHPFSDEMDISKIVKKINPEILVLKNAEIFQLISASRILITVDLSTTILESQILRKPVFTVGVKNYDFGTHEIFTHDSQLMTKIENFETKLLAFLNDQKLQEKKNQDQINYSNFYFSNLGSASKNILNFLVKI